MFVLRLRLPPPGGVPAARLGAADAPAAAAVVAGVDEPAEDDDRVPQRGEEGVM